MKPHVTIIAALLWLFASVPAWAQDDSTKIILNNFFQPDLVLDNAEKIDLGEKERAEIAASTEQTLRLLRGLRKQLQGEANRLAYLSGQDFVTEDAAASLKEILNLEGQIKEQQLRLLVKIKNILTQKQEGILRSLR